MAIPTFIQSSRFGRVIFQIRDGFLYVSERNFRRNFAESRLDLRSLDPNYTPRIIRLYALLIIPLVLALLCAVAIWGLFHQHFLPGEAMPFFYQWPVVGFVGSLIAAIRGTRRVEYYEFSNQWGKPVLNIIRERKQSADCTAFILTLVAQIELVKSDLPREEQAKLLRQWPDENIKTPGLELSSDWWKSSIMLGALATGIPLVPHAENYLAGLLFPIVFLICVGGAGLSVFSFLAKEPKRWWSTVGFVLSLIPVCFY